MEIIESSRARLRVVRTQTIGVADRPAIFSIDGPGAVDCLQGLLTNDVVKPGPGSLVYGAFLTPKGAVIVDCWLIRTADSILIVVDSAGRERTAGLLRRQLPPRLARVTDRSDALAVLWLLGPHECGGLATLFGGFPPPGRVATLDRDSGPWLLATGPRSAPFSALVLLPVEAVSVARGDLEAAGVGHGTMADLRIARVVAGVPTLGSEIDDRTFPQEVDFDRLEGVSYSKGCYVGQETVARIHFRGHPNWLLRGVRAEAGWEPVDEILAAGKPVARLGSLVRLENGDIIGLASVRREVVPGTRIGIDGRLLVSELPQEVT